MHGDCVRAGPVNAAVCPACSQLAVRVPLLPLLLQFVQGLLEQMIPEDDEEEFEEELEDDEDEEEGASTSNAEGAA